MAVSRKVAIKLDKEFIIKPIKDTVCFGIYGVQSRFHYYSSDKEECDWKLILIKQEQKEKPSKYHVDEDDEENE